MSFDYDELCRLTAKLEKLGADVVEPAQLDAANALALRVLTRTKKNCPVDTGHLRRSFTIIPAVIKGNYVEAQVINPVDYAMYVEFGHRQTPGRLVRFKDKKTGEYITRRLKKNWVNGKYMLTKAEEKTRGQADAIVKRVVEKHIKEALGDD